MRWKVPDQPWNLSYALEEDTAVKAEEPDMPGANLSYILGYAINKT